MKIIKVNNLLLNYEYNILIIIEIIEEMVLIIYYSSDNFFHIITFKYLHY